jgi:hypothetical protein
MLESLLSPNERALLPDGISSVTDAVIALCGSDKPAATSAIEKLWGRRITVLPPQQRYRTRNQILDNLLAQIESRKGEHRDTRKFRCVVPNPRRPSSELGQRYALIREGMTVGEYLNRGGRLRDLNKGLRRNHFTLEG